jgi:hypothetical protein
MYAYHETKASSRLVRLLRAYARGARPGHSHRYRGGLNLSDRLLFLLVVIEWLHLDQAGQTGLSLGQTSIEGAGTSFGRSKLCTELLHLGQNVGWCTRGRLSAKACVFLFEFGNTA